MLEEIAEVARIREFEARQTIFNEGDPCTGFYAVIDGTVKVYRLSAKGKEHVLHLLGPGDTFAEAAMFLDTDFLAHATAIKPSRTLFLPKEPFLGLLKHRTEIAVRMLASMAIILQRMVSHVEVLALKDASERLAQFLLEKQSESAVRLRVPKAVIASHLGISPETLSRLFLKMEGLGVARVSGRTIYVEDAERLKEIAAGKLVE